MTRSPQRFDAVIAEIDAANAADPRTVAIGGSTRPYELAYAERMSEQLLRIYPEASELLRIAARAQHIRRWDIPRTSFPQGRQGYMDWRRACREHHSQLVTEIMLRHDYGEEQTSRVAMLIKKEKLKKDEESQALENVVAVVFLDHYFEEFLAGHSDYNDENSSISSPRPCARCPQGDMHRHWLSRSRSARANWLRRRLRARPQRSPRRALTEAFATRLFRSSAHVCPEQGAECMARTIR